MAHGKIPKLALQSASYVLFVTPKISLLAAIGVLSEIKPSPSPYLPSFFRSGTSVLYPRQPGFWAHVSLESIEPFTFDPRRFPQEAQIETT